MCGKELCDRASLWRWGDNTMLIYEPRVNWSPLTRHPHIKIRTPKDVRWFYELPNAVLTTSALLLNTQHTNIVSNSPMVFGHGMYLVAQWTMKRIYTVITFGVSKLHTWLLSVSLNILINLNKLCLSYCSNCITKHCLGLSMKMLLHNMSKKICLLFETCLPTLYCLVKNYKKSKNSLLWIVHVWPNHALKTNLLNRTYSERIYKNLRY